MMENPSFLENKVNGKNYLVSSTKWVPIYSIKDNCNVPLIPGIYQIAVKHKDRSFLLMDKYHNEIHELRRMENHERRH